MPGADQTIDDPTIRRLIQMWILGEPVSGASAVRVLACQDLHVETVQLSAPSALERELRLHGQSIEAMRVRVFDLSGRLQVEARSGGPQLRFSLLNGQGQPLANGVYLYVVGVQGRDGERWQSAVRKLLVLR